MLNTRVGSGVAASELRAGPLRCVRPVPLRPAAPLHPARPGTIPVSPESVPSPSAWEREEHRRGASLRLLRQCALVRRRSPKPACRMPLHDACINTDFLPQLGARHSLELGGAHRSSSPGLRRGPAAAGRRKRCGSGAGAGAGAVGDLAANGPPRVGRTPGPEFGSRSRSDRSDRSRISTRLCGPVF
jgi:hypothetical protein